ncbi:uncharacterized protein LOC129224899 [Uloborus diversus]|uniref:uncharacterized protein LOC129224899 n=1 Tax=Uloborus diversus TaxID=327109 RepID=UPI0024093BC4|nr:uncharacterized protein LOC129224899 [Uloborus diversus]
MVTEEHKKSFHAGLSTLLVRLREKYWILGVRKLATQVISNCVICKRHTVKPLEVPFAPLSRDRVTHAGVFEVSGTDYAGPLYLRSGEKAWVILFTCAVYRAVHFELVKSMSTESFILALRRFVARRGRIVVLYTDNGLSFVGTNNVLWTLDWNKISSYSTTRQISWKFVPPTAAWWGGWWERMVGMLKDLLRRMLGKSSVNYEELSTILCDCEAVINSRPLTYILSSPDQLMPLPPAMFLVSDKVSY